MSFVPVCSLIGDGPRAAWILHGILGSRGNWSGFARQLAARLPGWRFLLVDLRNHGDSHGAAPPHTVSACAADLGALVPEFGAPEAVVGHSFGGKVALVYARDHAVGLQQVWSLDSPPGARREPTDHEVAAVISTARALPEPFPSRQTVTAHFREAGFSEGLADWMTTNVRRGPAGLAWRFDLDGIEAMIADYWQVELWPYVEGATVTAVHLVKAGRSDRWAPTEMARFEAHRHHHTLSNAGHWLHVDDPEGLALLLSGALE